MPCANPNLCTFTPRQVMLAQSQMKQDKQNDVSTKASSQLVLNGAIDEPTGLNDEHKNLLLHSVALYLERNGFSKTLKKFKSEALVSKNGLKDTLLDLEEVCIKYLKTRDHPKTDSNSQTEEAMLEEPGRKHKDKSKKKSKLVSESLLDNVKEQGLESLEGEPFKKSDPLLLENELNEKSKGKKSQKKVKSELSVDDSDQRGVEKENKDEDLESSKNPKKKSKRKKDYELNPNMKDSEINDSITKRTDLKNNSLEDSRADDGEKISKKRKKSRSEGHESKPIDEKVEEGYKRRKVEVLGERLENEKNPQTNAVLKNCSNGGGKERRVESDIVSAKESEKVPVNWVGEKENGSKSSSKKAMKTNEIDDSSEPKTKNAFQRVKVDDVVFTDKRLEDNSYWAKGGSEIGYGAKAQEVLGQVRGRDFRHEKTKKKRGSYRGGLIDLQSHSVKFSYSDDDE